MSNGKMGLLTSLFVNVVLAGFLIVTTVTLISERSKDIVRLTVWDDELLPTVRTLQPLTHKVAYAYPIGNNAGEARHWRIIIDDRSEKF